MTQNNIGATTTGSVEITDYSTQSEYTDGASGSSEVYYVNNNWNKQYGSYKNHPEITKVIDALGIWVIGKGFETKEPEDRETQLVCDLMRGNGNDSFNTIIRNLFCVSEIGGDSFGEIIRNQDGKIINLKPLNPGRIKIISNKTGKIIGYEQLDNMGNRLGKRLPPSKIFHLSRNRVADNISGQSLAEILLWLLEAKHEAMKDYRIVQHWNVKPRWKHRLKTDDPDEIAAYKAKMDANKATGEDIFEPYDVAESELVSVPANATMNPMTWIEYLDSQFYEQSGVPKIIVGGSSEFVEKATTIVYLAFQQTVEAKQLYLEEQIANQLGIEVNFKFPATVQNDLISDEQKDGELNVDPSQAQVGQTQQ